MIDLELTGIEQFTGTENYYGCMGVKITDGVKFVIKNGYGWFVTDLLIARKLSKKLLREEFLSFKLKIGKQTVATIDNGNNLILYTQKYGYSDAKKPLNLFLTGNVLMLAQEY